MTMTEHQRDRSELRQELALHDVYQRTKQLRIIQLLSQNISQTPQASVPDHTSMITFGMFSGQNQSTEADFELAQFHGDPDDGLSW